MVFWLIVGAVVVIFLGFAWRADRRRKVTITRRNAAVEADIARGTTEVVNNRLRGGGGRSVG